MSYSNKRLVRVNLPLFDFGGGAAEIMSFRLPNREDGTSSKGRLVGMGVMVTEVFATGATEGSVQLGTAANADAYAKLTIPTATADKDCFDVTDDTDAIIDGDIDKDTLLQVTLTNGTDGSAVTGQGIPYFDFYVW